MPFFGGDKGSRTPDLLHAKQTRYQLRYTPKVVEFFNRPVLRGGIFILVVIKFFGLILGLKGNVYTKLAENILVNARQYYR